MPTQQGHNATEITAEAIRVLLAAIASGTATEATLQTLATAAKQDTLAALVATAAKQDAAASLLTSILALQGAMRSKTTPDLADATASHVELDDRGMAYVKATLGSKRILNLVAEGVLTGDGLADLTEGPCDGVMSETADTYVFGRLREDAEMVDSSTVSAAQWTLGDGWTNVGGIVTHTAGGGLTADLEYAVQTTNPILVGAPFCLVFTVSGRTAQDVTPKLGTAAGSAISANGVHIVCLTAADNGKVIFTPHADFDGAIDIASVRVYSQINLPTASKPEAWSFARIVGVSAKGTPATLVASPATANVKAVWHRVAGYVEA